MMKWTIETVRKALGGKLIGRLYMREMVCKAILLLPDEMIVHVTKHVWFISSQDDAWAFTFRGSDVHGAHLIFLSDELLSAEEEQIIYTILHEIGHVVLEHRNSLGGYIQTESEIKQQEREADRFAKKYFPAYG
jgi:Zn-dependent protease with chaperone function